MLLVHVFVCLALVDFCPVPLDGREWLRLVIVALPGFHINFLSQTIFPHERAGNQVTLQPDAAFLLVRTKRFPCVKTIYAVKLMMRII